MAATQTDVDLFYQETITSEKQYDIKVLDHLIGPQYSDDVGKKTMLISLDKMLVHVHDDESQKHDFYIE